MIGSDFKKTVSFMTQIITDDEFARWAFGDTWDEFKAETKDPIELFKSWVTLHGDLYMPKEENNIQVDVSIMEGFYKKFKTPPKE